MVGSETLSSFASEAALLPPSTCFLKPAACSSVNLNARPRLEGTPSRSRARAGCPLKKWPACSTMPWSCLRSAAFSSTIPRITFSSC